jgi:hypothetical protein
VEVDRHNEPPAAEAGAFKAVQRNTQWKSVRSGTGRDSRILQQNEISSTIFLSPPNDSGREVTRQQNIIANLKAGG